MILAPGPVVPKTANVCNSRKVYKEDYMSAIGRYSLTIAILTMDSSDVMPVNVRFLFDAEGQATYLMNYTILHATQMECHGIKF